MYGNLNTTDSGNWHLMTKGVGEVKIDFSDYVNQHCQSLKSKYLSFIADLSEADINGIRLPDHFKVDNGHNIWWMSLISEKSVYKSPRITQCIYLIALEEILLSQKINVLAITTEDEEIRISVKNMCEKLGINISIDFSNSFRAEISFRSLYVRLPETLKALIVFIRHIISSSFSRPYIPKWFSGFKSVFIFSYFIHLDQKKSALGQFYSRQWECLPDLLKSKGVNVNWCHIFLKNDVTSTYKEGEKLKKLFNENNLNNGIHSFLRENSNIIDSFRALYFYFKLKIKMPKKGVIENAFRFKNSAISFWPLLKKDWNISFHGTVAIQNLIWIFQFERLLKTMPTQHLGFYLLENQGWERAFITAWKKYGHGKLIGLQHSSLRFWDLRYFDDQRIFQGLYENAQPNPHLIALNGPIPLDMYLKAGYRKNRFIMLEALRYLAYGFKEQNIFIEKNDTLPKVIILGDISIDTTQELINKFCVVEKNKTKLAVKFHPGAILNTADYPNLELIEEKGPLSSILPKYSTAIAIGSTTAALDAYLCGLNVIVYLKKGELNMSPLFRFDKVVFTNDDLLKRVEENLNADTYGRKEYFWMNPEIPRWNEFLDQQKF